MKRFSMALCLALGTGFCPSALAAQDANSTPLRSQVAKALSEGRCEDAETLAQQSYDFDLKGLVSQLCIPSTDIDLNLPGPTSPPAIPVSQATEENFTQRLRVADAAFVEKNFKLASDIYNELSVVGRLNAKVRLANMYIDGLGVNRNYDKAFDLLKYSANKGSKEAQYLLGWMYYSGSGVPEDDKEALKWYKTSASQGYIPAKENITKFIALGLATQTDQPILNVLNDRDPFLISLPTAEQMEALYPASASSKSVQGIVEVDCLVNIQGIATKCDIQSEVPNGYGFGTVTIIAMRASSFAPAMKNGEAVEAKFSKRFSWMLPKSFVDIFRGQAKENTVVCADGTKVAYDLGGPFCIDHGGAANIRFKSY